MHAGDLEVSVQLVVHFVQPFVAREPHDEQVELPVELVVGLHAFPVLRGGPIHPSDQVFQLRDIGLANMVCRALRRQQVQGPTNVKGLGDVSLIRLRHERTAPWTDIHQAFFAEPVNGLADGHLADVQLLSEIGHGQPLTGTESVFDDRSQDVVINLVGDAAASGGLGL